MYDLPEGWESDYDGTRWFYRYKPSGIVQFHFPKEGDEFPQFFDAAAPPPDLAPEEKLESQQQIKRRVTTGHDGSEGREKRKATSSMRATGGPLSASWDVDDDDDDAGGFFQPEAFMYLGPGSYNDVSPLGDEDEAELAAMGKGKGKDMNRSESLRKEAEHKVSPAASGLSTPQIASGQPVTPEPVQSASVMRHTAMGGGLVMSEPIMSPPVTSEPVTIPPVLAAETQTAQSAPVMELATSPNVPMLDSRERPYELPEAPRLFDPVGIVAEMPTEATAMARIELHPDPVEMPDNSVLAPIETNIQSGPVELPTHRSPVEPKTLDADEIRRLRQQNQLNQPTQRVYPFQPREDDDPDRPPTPLGSQPPQPAPPTQTPTPMPTPIQAHTIQQPATQVVQPYQPNVGPNHGATSTQSQTYVMSPPVPPKTPAQGFPSTPTPIPEAGPSGSAAPTPPPQQQFKIARKPTNAGSQPSKFKPYTPQPGSASDSQQREPPLNKRASLPARSLVSRETSLMLPSSRDTSQESSTPSILSPPQLPPKMPLEQALAQQTTPQGRPQHPPGRQSFSVEPPAPLQPQQRISPQRPFSIESSAPSEQPSAPPLHQTGIPTRPEPSLGKFPSVLKPGHRPGPPAMATGNVSKTGITGPQLPQQQQQPQPEVQHQAWAPQPMQGEIPPSMTLGALGTSGLRPGIQRVETTPNLPTGTGLPTQYKPFVPQQGRSSEDGLAGNSQGAPPTSQAPLGRGYPHLQQRPHSNSLPGIGTQGSLPLSQQIAAQRIHGEQGPQGQQGQAHMAYRPPTVQPPPSQQHSTVGQVMPKQVGYSPKAANPQSFAERVGAQSPRSPSQAQASSPAQSFPASQQHPSSQGQPQGQGHGRTVSMSSANSPPPGQPTDMPSPVHTISSVQSLQKTPPQIENQPVQRPGPLQHFLPPGHQYGSTSSVESPMNFRPGDVSPPEPRSGNTSSGYPLQTPSPIESRRQSSFNSSVAPSSGRPGQTPSLPSSTSLPSMASGSQTTPSSYHPSPLSTDSGGTFTSPQAPTIPRKAPIPQPQQGGYFPPLPLQPLQPDQPSQQGQLGSQWQQMQQPSGPQDTNDRRRSLPPEQMMRLMQEQNQAGLSSPSGSGQPPPPGANGRNTLQKPPPGQPQLLGGAPAKPNHLLSRSQSLSRTPSPGAQFSWPSGQPQNQFQGQEQPPPPATSPAPTPGRLLHPIREHPETDASAGQAGVNQPTSQASQGSSQHRHSISTIPQPQSMLGSGQTGMVGGARPGMSLMGVSGQQQQQQQQQSLPPLQAAQNAPSQNWRQSMYRPPGTQSSVAGHPGQLPYGSGSPAQPTAQAPGKEKGKWYSKLLKTTKSLQKIPNQKQQFPQQVPQSQQPGQFVPLTGQTPQMKYQQDRPQGPQGLQGMQQGGRPMQDTSAGQGPPQGQGMQPGMQQMRPGSNLSQRPISQFLPGGQAVAQYPGGPAPQGMSQHQGMPQVFQQQGMTRQNMPPPGMVQQGMVQQGMAQQGMPQGTPPPQQENAQARPRTNSVPMRQQIAPLQTGQNGQTEQTSHQQTQSPNKTPTQRAPSWDRESQDRSSVQASPVHQQQQPQPQPQQGQQRSSAGQASSSSGQPSFQRPQSAAEPDSDRASTSTMDVSEAQAQPVLKPHLVQVTRPWGTCEENQAPIQPPAVLNQLRQDQPSQQPGMYVQQGQGIGRGVPGTPTPMVGVLPQQPAQGFGQYGSPVSGVPRSGPPTTQPIQTGPSQPGAWQPGPMHPGAQPGPGSGNLDNNTNNDLRPAPLFSNRTSPSPPGHKQDPSVRESIISAVSTLSSRSSRRVSVMSTASSSTAPKRNSTFLRKLASKPKADYSGGGWGDDEDDEFA